VDFEDGASINLKVLMSMNKPISYEVYKAVDISVKLQKNRVELIQIMVGPIICPETSLSDYHYTLRNIPEERRSQGDMITMVTLKLYNSEFFFQTSKCQAPCIFMQSVSPRRSFETTDGFHVVRSHTFEGHLYAVSFNPHQSAITT
jgi:hypothetical protein